MLPIPPKVGVSPCTHEWSTYDPEVCSSWPFRSERPPAVFSQSTLLETLGTEIMPTIFLEKRL